MLESFFKDSRYQKHAVYARWCWTDTFSTSGPEAELWKHSITTDDLQLVANVFNAFETYEVLVTSELLDLQTTTAGSTNDSVFTEAKFRDPASIISASESASRLADALDLEEELNRHLLKGSQMASGTALFNEKELQFLAGHQPNQSLFQGQSGKCVEWIRENSKFCEQTVMGSSDRCIEHRNSGEFSLAKIINYETDFITYYCSKCGPNEEHPSYC